MRHLKRKKDITIIISGQEQSANFGCGNTNDRGLQLLEFTRSKDLTTANTLYPHKRSQQTHCTHTRDHSKHTVPTQEITANTLYPHKRSQQTHCTHTRDHSKHTVPTQEITANTLYPHKRSQQTHCTHTRDHSKHTVPTQEITANTLYTHKISQQSHCTHTRDPGEQHDILLTGKHTTRSTTS